MEAYGFISHFVNMMQNILRNNEAELFVSSFQPVKSTQKNSTVVC